MLQGLGVDQRRWLEHMAREQAIDADRFHALYPDIADRKLMTALRVEARLRRAATDEPARPATP